jgi:hypothetical protein
MNRQCVLNRVVIAGITGFAGGSEAGVGLLIEELKGLLSDLGEGLGVPASNIIRMAWNLDSQFTNPFLKPDTDTHRDSVIAISKEPSYVAVIGHSLGGWSACLLSERLAGELAEKPDYVALIDPVFGDAGDFEDAVLPDAKVSDNWYQRNAIWVTDMDHCAGKIFDPLSSLLLGGLEISIKRCGEVGSHSGAMMGLSCGRKLDPTRVRNHERKWEKDRDGNVEKISCPIPPKKKRFISHTSIDDDEHIWELIERKIMSDLRALIEAE